MQPMRRASHGILAYLAQSVHGERRTAASGYAKTRAAGNEKVSLNFKNLWYLHIHTGKKGTPPLRKRGSSLRNYLDQTQSSEFG